MAASDKSGHSMGAHSFGDVKIWLVETSGLSRDALHIYIGFAIYLAVRIILRRYPAARWVALAVVMAAALGGEALDHLYEGSRMMRCDRPDHLRDLWNSALLPAILALTEPLWAGRTAKTPPEND